MSHPEVRLGDIVKVGLDPDPILATPWQSAKVLMPGHGSHAPPMPMWLTGCYVLITKIDDARRLLNGYVVCPPDAYPDRQDGNGTGLERQTPGTWHASDWFPLDAVEAVWKRAT